VPHTRCEVLFSKKIDVLATRRLSVFARMAATHTMQNILWEAARDKDIPDARDENCWPILKMVLKRDKIIETRSPEQWLKSFDRLRRLMRKEEMDALAERSISTDSGFSENNSLPDSGYDSYSVTRTEFV
jgi:hypothetical protein